LLNKTWTLTNLHEGRQHAIECKFASKLNKMDLLIATKHVSWQKVTQILGVDFEYTFSLVVKMTSL